MILLDRNKSTKEYEIDTSDGLKPYSHTVGDSVHKDETATKAIIPDISSLKKLNTTSMSGTL